MTSANFLKRLKALELKLNPSMKDRLFIFIGDDSKVKIGRKEYSIEEVQEKFPKARIMVVGTRTLEWEREREEEKTRLRGEISSNESSVF